MAADERGLDLSFTANHMGKKSESDILGKGVLSGQARKVFRGTLNFVDGSAQSVGKEEEIVLLLSEKVKADSIPALMCQEDDVIGEHGASIGQLDEEQLFYLMSRGLPESEAKLLVIASGFREILEGITDEKLRLKSLDAIDRRIQDVI
jgi:Fe-S cluster assembly scaffold protein SufB